MRATITVVLLAVLLSGCKRESVKVPPDTSKTERVKPNIPPAAREFRAVWIATVDNIDWPSKPGLTTGEQQAELIAILDQCAAMNMNAVVFQMRPVADAFYRSPTEPWSAYLSGNQGQAPDPPYDPLSFVVEQAHARGLELHAWFNPYRAQHPSNTTVASNHVSKQHPEWVRTYGRYLWLDPGDPAVLDYVLGVIGDVIARYDIDGIHIDDYFYPYPIKDDAGNPVGFPDDETWGRYQESGGTLSRDDWRRDNVNQFIERLYKSVREASPHVKVGISPFGIWRPGNPEQIQGFDAYDQLYADSKLWFERGWVDYYTPQLYWPIEQHAQSYPVLLKWWTEQNKQDRHLWPGLFTSRIADGSSNWPASEIVNQIYATRIQQGATGHVHFSVKAIMQNRDGVIDSLAQAYAAPALIPATTWLDNDAPPTPKIRVDHRFGEPVATVYITPAAGEPAMWWLVQWRCGKHWETRILPGSLLETAVSATFQTAPLGVVSVAGVDRCGNVSEPAIAN